ncbi:3-oxoacyl-[acyl-carrier-protein] synthase III C-terminal domain-containing protein [Frankia sp. Cas3]|uniref:3-oxoacyl-[acyl-carrier-protein] synthase III C-terminal domain-containing protein n=1 Tax=Frankia sp. Cas3 TaxID=3073926 RepID=UPI002AD2C511|nr:3-oxoacyl-[acyl-carrier-protein] synthase III C-terminal domain-containing protein [Frankia sp. Cas3]
MLTCVIGADLDRGYLVENVEHIIEPELSVLDPVQNTLRFIDLFAGRMTEVCARSYARTGRNPDEFAALVLANLVAPVLKNYAAVARIPFRRVPTDNIARFGHCFAYDQLITLATLAECGATRSGDVVHVLGAGANYLFSSTVMRLL